jgi:hypothetical protein
MKKYNMVIIVVGLLLAFLFESALAVTSSVKRVVGGVNVRATKSISLGGYGWTTYLDSGAASIINIIGYTYWTLSEYCPQENPPRYAFYKQYGGDFNTNDDGYGRSAYVLYRGCNGISEYKSLGNHDFANGDEHIYPYVR